MELKLPQVYTLDFKLQLERDDRSLNNCLRAACLSQSHETRPNWAVCHLQGRFGNFVAGMVMSSFQISTVFLIKQENINSVENALYAKR